MLKFIQWRPALIFSWNKKILRVKFFFVNTEIQHPGQGHLCLLPAAYQVRWPPPFSLAEEPSPRGWTALCLCRRNLLYVVSFAGELELNKIIIIIIISNLISFVLKTETRRERVVHSVVDCILMTWTFAIHQLISKKKSVPDSSCWGNSHWKKVVSAIRNRLVITSTGVDQPQGVSWGFPVKTKPARTGAGFPASQCCGPEM